MARPEIQVVEGDITKVAASAIVNAANSGLAEGGGVCGAIFRAAGREELARACRAIGHCPTGLAVVTPAFDIATARHIIHAVGPVYASYSNEEARRLLRSAYRSAIELAVAEKCESIAFPAISTGIYGYPLEAACAEAVDVCAEAAAPSGIKVMLVAFDGATAECLRRALGRPSRPTSPRA
jgi:O-acetyl-ADP-ribose deacetylase (regulator of RNase III)